jgi:hypothetical protein
MEENAAPVLAPIGPKGVNEQTPLTFTASATDRDEPAQRLSYSLDQASIDRGMTIDPASGVFTWTPTEVQGGQAYQATITVTDDGVNPANLTDSETITISVWEINAAPVLAPIGPKGVNGQTLLTFTASATDRDEPAQRLSYSLDQASIDRGMRIDPASGVFTWTPTEVQDGQAYEATITVTDNGANPSALTDSETVRISVTTTNPSGYVLWEDFESGFPEGNGWFVNASRSRKWDESSQRSRSGRWSAHCAEKLNGASTNTYVNNMDTFMGRSVDLSDCERASLSFSYWLNSQRGRDLFRVLVNGEVLWSDSGSIKAWREATLDLSAYAGQTEVHVAFEFTSNRSVVSSGKAGVWVDDIGVWVESSFSDGTSHAAKAAAENAPKVAPFNPSHVDLALGSLMGDLPVLGTAQRSALAPAIADLSFLAPVLLSEVDGPGDGGTLAAARLDALPPLLPAKRPSRPVIVTGPARRPVERELSGDPSMFVIVPPRYQP